MTIQTIIKDWEKLCDNDSELNSVRRQVATILKDSLTSMLDGIEKEAKDLDCYTQTTLSSGKKVNLVSKEEVINIINSHK